MRREPEEDAGRRQEPDTGSSRALGSCKEPTAAARPKPSVGFRVNAAPPAPGRGGAALSARLRGRAALEAGQEPHLLGLHRVPPQQPAPGGPAGVRPGRQRRQEPGPARAQRLQQQRPGAAALQQPRGPAAGPGRGLGSGQRRGSAPRGPVRLQAERFEPRGRLRGRVAARQRLRAGGGHPLGPGGPRHPRRLPALHAVAPGAPAQAQPLQPRRQALGGPRRRQPPGLGVEALEGPGAGARRLRAGGARCRRRRRRGEAEHVPLLLLLAARRGRGRAQLDVGRGHAQRRGALLLQPRRRRRVERGPFATSRCCRDPGHTWSGCACASAPRAPPAMAGRGRGRGRGQMTFNVEAVGIGKGEALPPPTLQPSPLFPPLEHRAAPLPGGEEGEYMLALKQELRGAMRNLPYFVKPGAPRRDIERYSDKYQISSPVDSAIDWNPDWRRLPQELKIRVRRLRKNRATILVPKCKQRVALDKEETIKKLESLEKKEEEVTSEEEEEKEEEEEGKEEEEEEYDEEEHEEETDYIMSYFDNGEDFGADSDDNMDEAVY